MQSNSYKLSTSSQESYPLNPSAYTVYFEVRLDREDFGKKREKHNAVCNQQLLAKLEVLSAEGIELCETVSNAALMENIRKNPQESPHKSLTWHHCHSTTVRGDLAVMHLALERQHTKAKNIFHPNNKGGYFEWAIPMGAPVEKPKGYYPPHISKATVPTLPVHDLAPALLVAVGTNNYEEFDLVMKRAKDLKLSEGALTYIRNLCAHHSRL